MQDNLLKFTRSSTIYEIRMNVPLWTKAKEGAEHLVDLYHAVDVELLQLDGVMDVDWDHYEQEYLWVRVEYEYDSAKTRTAIREVVLRALKGD